MIQKYVIGKTAVFIDAANIFYSQRTLKWKISFKKLYKYLKHNCNLHKVYFYYTKSERSIKQKEFFEILEDTGYILKIKPLKVIKRREGDIIEKGNVDVELTMDIMLNMNMFDTIILMSGDSDFESILRYLRENGKRIIVVSTRGHISKELIRCSHKYIDFRKLRKELLLE